MKKQIVKISLIVLCALMTGCNNKNKLESNTVQTETEETTRKATGSQTEENANNEEIKNNTLIIKHVKLEISDEFEFFGDTNGTTTYATSERDKSFAIYVEDTNTYSDKEVVDTYIEEVKNVYGSQVTNEKKTYNGHEFTVMNIDNPDGSYIGNAAILCEGSTIIYIEYVTTTDDKSEFDTIMNTIDFSNKENKEQLTTEHEEKETKEPIDETEYETDITYEQLARRPDDYINKKIKLQGEVIQVMDGDDFIAIRLAVNSDHDNIIYCEYDKDIISYRILENDVITIYGVSYGLYTYETVSGNDTTIPCMLIDKIEQEGME